MRSKKSTWGWRVGAGVLLVGGLGLAGYGAGVTPAGADNPPILLGVTQNWDKNLPSASRFTVLAKFNNQAVRDNNTGLVWEQAPNDSPAPWFVTTSYCVNKNVGGTRGWRLPSVTELVSLIDPSLPAPFVPVSVFTGVQPFRYWSASTDAGDPTRTWYVNFSDGLVLSNPKSDHPFHAWCVRGPMQESVY